MRTPNRLINERSPYLLQHAYNPVDWYPWGEEAITKAKKENKMIFLSIGYSSCHWCHVMEKESFEDEKIAEIINTYFVPVKVDREERPDIDELYMKSVLLLTGHGGWPLTVFLTPELKPFFGGTYFPPRRRGGLRGLDEILRGVAELWRKNPDEVRRAAEQNAELVKSLYLTEKSSQIPSYNLVVQTFDVLASSYDSLYGGFGSSPKFPMPVYIEFLQLFSVLDRNTTALKMASTTLENMARGGIFDQLAGGFFRYSTDRIWLVPHFEKMLYDNALLAKVYLQNFQLTGKPFFKDIGVAILDWMIGELASPTGGFYSAVDADTVEGEGAFYVWKMKEVYEIFGEEDAKLASKIFGITDAGNFEHGKNILTFKRDIDDIAAELGVTAMTAAEKISQLKKKMLEARTRRPAPAIDDKVICSWNGMALSALTLGYQITSSPRFLEFAIKSADFIINNLWTGGKLYRIYKNGPAVEAFLDDHAFLVNGLLDLFQTVFEPRYLKAGIEIAERMIEVFWDREDGGFFYSAEETAEVARIKEAYDGVVPSGNSMAALALLKLSDLTGRTDYLNYVEDTFKCFATGMEQNPAEYAFLVSILAGHIGKRTEVVISCNRREEASDFLSVLRSRFSPFTTIVVVDEANRDELTELSQIVSDKPMLHNRTTAYVCQNFTCRMPVNTVEEFVKMLG